MQKRLQEQAFSANSGRQDLNLRPLDPQSSVLNQAELRPGFFGPQRWTISYARRWDKTNGYRPVMRGLGAFGPGHDGAAQRLVRPHERLDLIGRDGLAEEKA